MSVRRLSIAAVLSTIAVLSTVTAQACGAPPAQAVSSTYAAGTAPTVARTSAVRGDVDGDGFKDELALSTANTVLYFPGRADGSWGPMQTMNFRGQLPGTTWLASPGDLNGDGYQDILRRNDAGELWALFTDGATGIPTGARIGTGWGQMDRRLMTVAPRFAQGKTSVLAVNRSTCGLHRYDLGAGGGFTSSAQIGVGWCGMKFVVGLGDVTGDGIGDLGAVSASTGAFLLYAGLGNGYTTGAGREIGSGWAGFAQVTNNGDATGDGLGDIVAVAGDGAAYQYPIKRAPYYWGARQRVADDLGFLSYVE